MDPAVQYGEAFLAVSGQARHGIADSLSRMCTTMASRSTAGMAATYANPWVEQLLETRGRDVDLRQTSGIDTCGSSLDRVVFLSPPRFRLRHLLTILPICFST